MMLQKNLEYKYENCIIVTSKPFNNSLGSSLQTKFRNYFQLSEVLRATKVLICSRKLVWIFSISHTCEHNTRT